MNVICHHCRYILRQQEGAVAIIFGLFLVFVMIPVLALTIDLGGGFMMAAQMQNAATASSIASAIENADADEAERYFTANLPVGKDLINYDFSSDVDVSLNSDRTVSVTPTNFERPGFFSPAIKPQGVSIIKASSLSIASLAQGENTPASLLLVLDRSGSMLTADAGVCPKSKTTPCKRIQALRESVGILLDNIEALPDAEANYSVAGVTWDNALWEHFNYTNDFQHAQERFSLGLLKTGGSTCGYCGMNQAAEYLPDSPQQRKVLVYMTDGDANQLPFNYLPPPDLPGDYPYPMPQDIPNTSRPGEYWQKAVDLTAIIWKCNEMKLAHGDDLTVWTIRFGLSQPVSDASVEVLQYCASAPDKYVYAPDADALNKVFSQVFGQIKGLRLKQ